MREAYLIFLIKDRRFWSPRYLPAGTGAIFWTAEEAQTQLDRQDKNVKEQARIIRVSIQEQPS